MKQLLTFLSAHKLPSVAILILFVAIVAPISIKFTGILFALGLLLYMLSIKRVVVLAELLDENDTEI